MAEPDCVACLNHVVSVHNPIFEAEGGWEKGIVVIADIGYLVLDLQKCIKTSKALHIVFKKLTIEFVNL